MGTEPGLTYQNGAMPQADSSRPYYQPVGNEETGLVAHSSPFFTRFVAVSVA